MWIRRRFYIEKINDKQLVILSAFTTLVMLVAAFALVRGYISVEAACLTIFLAFTCGSCFVFWRKGRRKAGTGISVASKTSGLVWLLLLFSANACIGIIQGIHEGWDVGYTIGLAGFAVFASLSIYEIVRRKRMKTQAEKRAEGR
jgi:hypothetical protein